MDLRKVMIENIGYLSDHILVYRYQIAKIRCDAPKDLDMLLLYIHELEYRGVRYWSMR